MSSGFGWEEMPVRGRHDCKMTANRRIALNIVATYGRSLYALVIGLFCGRWTLMALGEVDCVLRVDGNGAAVKW